MGSCARRAMTLIYQATRRPLTSGLLRISRREFRSYKSTLPKSVAGYLDWKPEETAGGVHVDGYIRSVRAQKRHHFVSLGDGSTIDALQAVVPADQAEGWDK